MSASSGPAADPVPARSLVWLRRAAWLPVPLLLAAIAALRMVPVPGPTDRPVLLMGLNFAFLTMASFLVAFLTLRTFLVRGTLGLLMLSCGAVVWGAGGFASAAVSPHGVNAMVTVHNLSALLAGACHLLGVAVADKPWERGRGGDVWLPLVLIGGLAAVGLASLAAMDDWLPLFFEQGRGGTPLRQVVLGTATAVFAAAAAVLQARQRHAPSAFTCWYSVALALLATGLLGVTLQHSHGSALNWVSRAAQYLGGVYMVVATLASVRESRAWEVRLESALAESEQRFQELFNTMTEGFAVHDILCDERGEPVDFRFLEINPAFERLTGLGRDILGKRHNEVLPDDDPRWVKIYGKVALTGEPVQFENYSPALKRHYEVVAFRPAPGRFATLFKDITERKVTEERLKATLAEAERGRQTLQTLMEHVPEGITIADGPDATIRMVSRFGARLLGQHAGVTAAEVAQRRRVFQADRVTPLADEELPLVRAVRRGETVTNVELVQTDERGERLGLLCNAAPIRAADGSVTGGIVAWRDVTEIRRTQDALREREAKLREADQRKNEFMATLSHELRNPLAPIRNAIHILHHGGSLDERARRAAAIIDRQTEHLARLVDDLLDVSRITRGKVRLELSRVDLGELVRRAVDDHRAGMQKLDLKVEAPPAPLWVDGDPMRLSQVVGNLLQNAAKFTPPGGRVSVRLAALAGEAVLEVEDDGSGIDAQTLSRLFEPFAQADRTLDRSRGGLGLGLALVKGVVELHGGAVVAHSDGPGKGSRFTVRLPAREAPAPGPAQAAAAPGVGGPRRVLVIEDNVDAAESLREVLGLSGYRVELAHRGSDGLAAARRFRPHVVLCDIGLPEMDGYEVARALRSEAGLAGVYLVALSGYARPEDKEKAREAGFDTHVAKPPDLAALEKLLREAPLVEETAA